MKSIEDVFEVQKWMQTEIYKTLPKDLDSWPDNERALFIKDNILASLDELHEALGEVGWKPWASSRHINYESFQSELVDVFHFFINLMIAGKMDISDLIAGYQKKNKKNIDRQKNGYDGIAGKCPACKRAYDDVGVKCNPKVGCTAMKANLN